MPCSIILETERLLIRPLTQADIDDLHAMLSDIEVMRYYPAVHSREESEKWLDGILRDYESNGYGMLGAYLKGGREFVGLAGIMRRQIEETERYFLSYLIRKELWKQGYATEAVRSLLDYHFRKLGTPKVQALIRPDNAPSIALAEKLGLRRTESTFLVGGMEHLIYVLTAPHKEDQDG